MAEFPAIAEAAPLEMPHPQTLRRYTREEPIMGLGTASTILSVAVFASTVQVLGLVRVGVERICISGTRVLDSSGKWVHDSAGMSLRVDRNAQRISSVSPISLVDEGYGT